MDRSGAVVERDSGEDGCGENMTVSSFTVPYTDDQIEVDTDRRVVMWFRNAWNRESSGYPDETHTFDALLADKGLLVLLTASLAGNDAAELQRLIRTPPA